SHRHGPSQRCPSGQRRALRWLHGVGQRSRMGSLRLRRLPRGEIHFRLLRRRLIPAAGPALAAPAFTRLSLYPFPSPFPVAQKRGTTGGVCWSEPMTSSVRVIGYGAGSSSFHLGGERDHSAAGGVGACRTAVRLESTPTHHQRKGLRGPG